MINRLLKTLALIIRPLNPPHFLKYGFFLLLKNRKIGASSNIQMSGARVSLNLGNFIDYWIFMDGSYEGAWIEKVKDLVDGKTFIDIGANIGIYTLSLFKKAKCVYAFEPEKKNYQRLVHNLKINSVTNVKTYRCAIANKNGVGILYVSKNDGAWNSLSIPYSGGKQKVETITLDFFVGSGKVHNVGLIKIDVEGAELDILGGSHKTLQRFHPPILIEFNGPRSQLSGYSLKDMYKLITKYNYRGYRLADNRLAPLKISSLPSDFNDNILFIR